MAAPNIVNVVTITGKTAVQAVPATATAIITNSAGSGKVIKVNALMVGNVDTVTPYELIVDVYRGTTAYRFVPSVAVPAKATMDVLNKAIYLEEGDSMRLTASGASKLEAVASYEEIS